LNSLIVDLKNLIKYLIENVQLYPVCDTCFRGEEKEVSLRGTSLKKRKIRALIFDACR